MPRFRADLTARQVHSLLQKALQEMDRAERNAVLWFCEILHRELYFELGYSSIQQYASEGLGFSRSKTYQFIRLAGDLQKLPLLRRAVARGEIGWTKARELVKVITFETQKEWIAKARGCSNRRLEQKILAARDRTQAARNHSPRQPSLKMTVPGPSGEPAATKPPMRTSTQVTSRKAAEVRTPALVVEVPVTVTFRFSPAQWGRYEALLEQIEKRTRAGKRSTGKNGRQAARRLSREELLLAALEDHLAGLPGPKSSGQAEPTRPEKRGHSANGGQNPAPVCTRGDRKGGSDEPGRHRAPAVHPPYQIIIHRCEECGRGEIRSREAARQLSPAALMAATCDARVLTPDGPNRATIPPAMRRRILARDGHRCRMKGCGQIRFLEVHHLVPRAEGGRNTPGNLVTLCAGCHRLLHERYLSGEKRHDHLFVPLDRSPR